MFLINLLVSRALLIPDWASPCWTVFFISFPMCTDFHVQHFMHPEYHMAIGSFCSLVWDLSTVVVCVTCEFFYLSLHIALQFTVYRNGGDLDARSCAGGVILWQLVEPKCATNVLCFIFPRRSRRRKQNETLHSLLCSCWRFYGRCCVAHNPSLRW